jgi:hypothetical protein
MLAAGSASAQTTVVAPPQTTMDAVREAVRTMGPEVTAFVRQAALATISRARRKVSIGPLVGGSSPYLITDQAGAKHLDGTASFGLGLYLWDVAVLPSTDWFMDALEERVKERIKLTLLDNQPLPGRQDLERLVREVWEDVKGQLLDDAGGSLHERPSFKLVLEGGYLMRSAAWEPRITLGFGVSVVTIGITCAGAFRDHNAASLGPEVAFHLTLGKGPRAHVVDIFARGDYYVNNRRFYGEQFALGLRFMLDLL